MAVLARCQDQQSVREVRLVALCLPVRLVDYDYLHSLSIVALEMCNE